MPEMADVEVVKRRFQENLIGEKITGVKILNPALVKVPDLEKKITGQKILDARRYGKYLFLKIDAAGWMIVHFGLTGHLLFEKDKHKKYAPSAMLILTTDSFLLIYQAYKVFGSVDWCAEPEDFIREKKLGPDAGSVSENDFVKILRTTKGAVKPALMDQHKIAGVGNVYADEILFQTRIHPKTSVADLTDEQLRKVFAAIHKVHEAAVKVHAVRTKMPEWAFMRVRKTTHQCPNCGGKFKNILVNNRETFFCPHCQPEMSG